MTATMPISVMVRVNSRRMKLAPRSGSSLSARTSTGTTREVMTLPRTISVIMFGSVFAVVNAEATAPPSIAPMSRFRMKPVMREINVAIAIEPVEATTCPSEVLPSSARAVSVAWPSPPTPETGAVGGVAVTAGAVAVAVAVLGFILYSTITAPRYDGKVTVYCYEYFSEEDLTYIENWITPYYPDVNENGETLLLVTDCSFSLDTDQKSYVDNMMLKIQSILSGQKDAMLFILDEKSIEYLNGISEDFILFTKENIVEIPESFYGELPEGRYTFPNNKKRYLCLRTIGGTSLEGEKAKQNYKAAKQVIEKLKKENPTAEDLFDTETEENIQG